MNRKVINIVCFIVAMVFFLTGCWNKRELTDLAIISAIGIDKDPDGRRYKGSFQIINPGNVAGGLQGGTGGGQAATITTYTTTGESLMELARRVKAEASRELYYSHTNVVAISDELASEEGLYNVLETLDRDDEFRDSTLVVIAKDTTAENLVSTLTPVDKVPANKIVKTLLFAGRGMGEIKEITIQELIRQLVTDGRAPLIPGFVLKGDIKKAKDLENIQNSHPDVRLQADGLGMIKGGKLIGWLTGPDAEGTQYILDKIKGDFINIDWKGKKSAISYSVMKSSTDVSIMIKDGKPHVNVHIKPKGMLNEITVPINIRDQNNLKKIEKQINQQLKEHVEGAIATAKENKIDMFGFGVVLYRKYPHEWHKMKNDWDDEHFPNMTVDVSVDSKILYTGIRNVPFLYQMKKHEEE